MDKQSRSSDWSILRMNFKLIQQQVCVQHSDRACEVKSIGDPYRLGGNRSANGQGGGFLVIIANI